MDKCLIFYGYHEQWDQLYRKESIKNKLRGFIQKVIIIYDIESLKNFLRNEGQNYKNYILPTLVEHIVELNNAWINSLFQVNSTVIDELCHKKKFSDYINSHNLSEYAPRIYSKWCDRNNDTLVVVKPPYSCFSIGVYTKKLHEVQDKEFDENAIQEYIKERIEYAGYFVSYNGRVTLAFAYITIYPTDTFIKHNGGVNDGIQQTKVELPEYVIQTVEKFLLPASFTGTSSFDFKIVNGKMKVFEINPRLGGSLKNSNNEEDFLNIIKHLMQIYDERNVYN
jgi:glutathione synthase/RimK-type ligase-like ATP-grasp enzyme